MPKYQEQGENNNVEKDLSIRVSNYNPFCIL